MADEIPGWEETDSALFLDDGAIFVPARQEQIATVCALVPADTPGLAVDLCCGEGLLGAALLERHAGLRLLALDGSALMRRAAGERLASHGERATVAGFDLADGAWRRFAEPPLAVVSSLAVHHLDGAGKRRLYADMAAALQPGGVLVIADLVAPAADQGWRLAAQAWDRATLQQARAADRPQSLARFKAEQWNFFADPEPDPVDQPSGLVEQLNWFAEAGLERVDVNWMWAGHAIFSGYRPV